MDDDTKAVLTERLRTIERDAKESEEWTPELKARLIRELKDPVAQWQGSFRFQNLSGDGEDRTEFPLFFEVLRSSGR